MPTVRVDPESGRILLRIGVIAAISVDAWLGRAVMVAMARDGNDGGPIVAYPRTRRWTFLVRPDLPAPDADEAARLWRCGVSVSPVGGEIGLPSPADRGAFIRQWVRWPATSYRPSARVVLAAIEHALR